MSRLWHQRYQRSDSTAATGRDDLAVEEGFPSLPSPRRGLQTANQRGAGAKAFHKGQHGCQRQAAPRCHSNVMCHRFAAFPDSVAEKRPWRLGGDVRETAMLHSLSSPRSGRMHHSEAHLQKRARPRTTGQSRSEISSCTLWPGLTLIPSCPAAMRAV